MSSAGQAHNTARDVSFLTPGPAREKHAGARTLPAWPRIQLHSRLFLSDKGLHENPTEKTQDRCLPAHAPLHSDFSYNVFGVVRTQG